MFIRKITSPTPAKVDLIFETLRANPEHYRLAISQTKKGNPLFKMLASSQETLDAFSAKIDEMDQLQYRLEELFADK